MSYLQGQLPHGTSLPQQIEEGDLHHQQQQQQPHLPIQQQMQYTQSPRQDGQFLQSEVFGHCDPRQQQHQEEFQSLIGTSQEYGGSRSMMHLGTHQQISQADPSLGKPSQEYDPSKQQYQHYGLPLGSQPVIAHNQGFGDPQSMAPQPPDVTQKFQSTLEANQGVLQFAVPEHHYQHQSIAWGTQPGVGPGQAYGGPQSMMEQVKPDVSQNLQSMKGDQHDQHLQTSMYMLHDSDPSRDFHQHPPAERFIQHTSLMDQGLAPAVHSLSDLQSSKEASNSSSTYNRDASAGGYTGTGQQHPPHNAHPQQYQGQTETSYPPSQRNPQEYQSGRTYVHGQQHQLQGPAVGLYHHGQQHQLQGPAVGLYPHGQQHQLQGPAVGLYPHGQQHQLHGPAVGLYHHGQQHQLQGQTANPFSPDTTHQYQGQAERPYPPAATHQYQGQAERPHPPDVTHQYQEQAERPHPPDVTHQYQGQAQRSHPPDTTNQYQGQAQRPHPPDVTHQYQGQAQRSYSLDMQHQQSHLQGNGRPSLSYTPHQQRQFQGQVERPYSHDQQHQQPNLRGNARPTLATPTGARWGQRDHSPRHLQPQTAMFDQYSVGIGCASEGGPHHAQSPPVPAERDLSPQRQYSHAPRGPNPYFLGDHVGKPAIEHPTGDPGYPDNQPKGQASHGATEPYGDGHRLLLMNIGPGTFEDTLKNFLESKADADIEGFEWAENKKSAIVTFKTKLDVPTVIAACKSSKIEGSNIKVKPVPRSKCLKVEGLSRNATKDSIRFYFENKKNGGDSTDGVDLYMEAHTALVHFTAYGTAEEVIEKGPHKLQDHILDVSIHDDLLGFSEHTVKDAEPSQRGTSPAVDDGDQVDGFRILVLNIGPRTSQDTLENFLEAKAGLDVTHVEWGNGRRAAVVTFKDRLVAERVCQSAHKLREHLLTVTMHTDTADFVAEGSTAAKAKVIKSLSDDDDQGEGEEDVPDDMKMLILNIAPATPLETLENFLEGKAESEVADIQWGGGDSCKSALVTFDSKPRFAKVKEACSKKMVEGHRLTVKQVMKSRCLRVTGLPDNTSKDSVNFYFENKRRGGPLKKIQFIPEKHTAYLWFKEYGVAERVCGQTLKLNDKTLKVDMHIDIPEFMPTEAEKDKGESSDALGASMIPVSKPKHQSQWRYLVKSVDAHIMRYINKSEPEKTKLQDDLKSHECELRFILQPNGVVLEATNKRTDTEGTNKETWMKRVDAAIQASLEEMNLTVETLEIPEGITMGRLQMNQDFQKILTKTSVRIYTGSGVLQVVGCRDRMKEALESLKEILALAGPKESHTQSVKNYLMRYLQRSSFLMRCSKLHPNVEVHLKVQDDMLTIEGSKTEVQSVKLMIHEEFNSLQKDSLTFKTNGAVAILRTCSLPKQLEDAGVVCSWQKEDQKRITLYCPNTDDICKARDIIKKTICEEIIRLDKSSSYSLQSADWREKRKQLLESYPGQLQIGVDTDAVMVAGDHSIFQDVVSEIDKYFDINSVREYFLQSEEPRVKFLQAHGIKKVRQLELSLRDLKVHIHFGEGFFACGFTISGLNAGINKARKELEKLLSSIKSKDHSLMLPGIRYYFTKGGGKELLTGIEHQTETIIRPKDLLQKMPSVSRSWTLSDDHIVSVVKGDICSLKVDAIAYTANTDLKLVAGLSKAIATAGGKIIQEECTKVIKDKGRPSVGEVICTGGGRLPCKLVLHAVSPKRQDGKHGEEGALQKTIKNILRQCKKKHVRSLALPAISTGLGYPLADAVKGILETLQHDWQKEQTGLREIILCDINPNVVEQFIQTTDSICYGARPKCPERKKKEEEEEEEEEEEDQRESDEGSREDEESSSDLSDAEDQPERIQVIVGELSKQKADVLVNPTGKDLNMSVGAVSKSLLQAGGNAIQTACKEKYPSGVKTGKVAMTTGGDLKCKMIFHGILQAWNHGKDAPDLVLQCLVKRCLEEADTKDYQSVAFPALGTGKLGFPADVSASLMFKAVSSFLKEHPGTSVQAIYFIVHPKDTPVKKAFEAESRKSDHDCSPSEHRRNDGARPRDSRANDQDSSHRRYPDTFAFGSMKIKIVQGDLTKENTDCIVSCSSESFDLKHGAVSKALLSAAGPELQVECTSRKDELSSPGLVLTQGYKLHCKHVLHLKVQTSAWGWGSTLLECLKRAEGEGLTSLSMPALGTGGQKIAPGKMASSLLYAVKKFADTHSQPTLQNVRVVIFQSPMVITYRAVFAGKQPGTDAPHERKKRDDRSGPRHHGAFHGTKAEDKIVLCIYSDIWTNITAARDRLKEVCADEFQTKTIGHKWASKIEKLDDEEISRLASMAGKQNVAIAHKGPSLHITGRVRNVAEVHEKIVELFQTEATGAHLKEEAKLVANLVEWMYVAGGKSRPFTPGLNCCLEKAYKAKEKSLEIKDARGRTYSVDFQKMTEMPKAGGKPIKIERLEKAIRGGLSKMVKGEKEAMSGTKTSYFSLKPERTFKGNAEDLHFRTAESQFYRLLGTSGSKYCVTKVDYVVNPPLIKKFRTAHAAMKAKRGPDKAEPVLAFHGTNEATIGKICEGGFKKPGDPGFAAKTDAGYYGSGVYFSEYPEYSMGYIAGAQKILLSQVILGEVFHCKGLMNGAPLQSGYDCHTSPDGKELIIFDTACILPCYIVHYGPSQGVFKYA
ncbi:protein mono-ADP-ribosyltransferase PARP14-like isoform X2 [Haliotis cracherodii]|uniref:protein mono-ADP-ribosyltransferase PARP14-like isoform X2 n=1 Tax=Haliotis cracherodii TaxID=6455 RepID=UPI0039E960D1